MSRKACVRVSSSPAKCPCDAKHWGWKTISGVLSGYSDAANVGTRTATSGDMREAGATTPIRHLSLLIRSPCSSNLLAHPSVQLCCTSSATLVNFADVPTSDVPTSDVPTSDVQTCDVQTWRLLFLRHRR